MIGRLGIITTCATILAPPIAYAVVSTYQLKDRAVEQAAVGALFFAVQLARDGAVDRLNQTSISVLHASHKATDVVTASWLTSKDDTVLMFAGEPARWPELRARQQVRSADFEGYFNVAVSSREIFVGTFFASIGFFLLGLAAYYCFRRLPLAALDDAFLLVDAKQQALLSKQSQLETQNERFDAALENLSQGLCMFDAEQRLVICNKLYAEMYGLTPEQVKPGTTVRQIFEYRLGNGSYNTADQEFVKSWANDFVKKSSEIQELTESRSQELADGRVINISVRQMANGGRVVTHQDITERRRMEGRIAHIAHHDALTDLPNRVLLRERLEHALSGRRRTEGVAVLCLDLDHFKQVNDTLGHPIGDALLKTIAERLRGCTRETDTVARASGDEFVIVQISTDPPKEATALAARIIEVLSAPYDLDGHQVVVGTSIGIAIAPNDGTDPDTLLKHADLALYRTKNEGRGTYRFFEQQMNARMQERRALEVDLRKALVNGEFELHYQPLVNLTNNEVSGLEALLRWNHPERGRVSPADFIPIAEDTGLIVPIGEWVLRQACAEAASWPEHVGVAVNISTVQFKSSNLVKMVFNALAVSGVAAARLELEITESVLIENAESALATLHMLRELGVKIAMDDFGTGYSSLSYLQSFPFDKIKIDRSFVKTIADGAGSLDIVRAVAAMANGLGVATTAEGVETQQQLDMVRAEGCTEMQGYFFSPPRPAAEIQRVFFSHAKRTAGAA